MFFELFNWPKSCLKLGPFDANCNLVQSLFLLQLQIWLTFFHMRITSNSIRVCSNIFLSHEIFRSKIDQCTAPFRAFNEKEMIQRRITFHKEAYAVCCSKNISVIRFTIVFIWQCIFYNSSEISKQIQKELPVSKVHFTTLFANSLFRLEQESWDICNA